ncbi:MAG: iron-containing redox enzyme family protein [Ignavibacteriales bacterium]|nr:iron-containing redox enzyme family protein [Ignavibacteriales bacterium]
MLTRTIIKHPIGIISQPSIADNESLSATIAKIIEKHNVLKHPFFQLWNCGAVSNDTLRVFVSQFYHLIKHFPRMLSAIHSNTSELLTRKVILKTLNREDGAKEHSAELWVRYAESLGISRMELENAHTLPKTRHLLDTMNNFCRNHSSLEGLASLYAYEVQLPPLFKMKMDGLLKYYPLTEKRNTKFFHVRQERDTVHSLLEREIIDKSVTTENYTKVTFAMESTAYAFWKFLDGIMEVYGKSIKQHTFVRLG